MKLHYLLILPCLVCAGYAQAEIYKHVDADGHVTYSSEPIKGGKKLKLEPLPTMTPFNSGNAEFPRVNEATQKTRDEGRRKILEDELATEEKQLAEARQTLKDAEDTPEVYHGPDGKTYRNVAKYEENVKNAKAEVTLHEQNVAALKAELSRLK